MTVPPVLQPHVRSTMLRPPPSVVLRQLIDDAAAKPDRLTAWERDFMGSMEVKLGIETSHLSLSDRQRMVLERIEKKVYAIG